MDSGFVAVLAFLPKLRVFLTEVGGRAGKLLTSSFVLLNKF
jgi:hypothetical protein